MATSQKHINKCLIPKSDAGLPNHLGAQVFCRQLEGTFQKSELLKETFMFCSSCQEQWAYFLQLVKRKTQKLWCLQFLFEDKQRDLSITYSCHSVFPVMFIIWQGLTDLSHGVFQISTGIDLLKGHWLWFLIDTPQKKYKINFSS